MSAHWSTNMVGRCDMLGDLQCKIGEVPNSYRDSWRIYNTLSVASDITALNKRSESLHSRGFSATGNDHGGTSPPCAGRCLCIQLPCCWNPSYDLYLAGTSEVTTSRKSVQESTSDWRTVRPHGTTVQAPHPPRPSYKSHA